MVAQRPPARLGRGQEVDLGAACREAGQASHRPASFERAAITWGTPAAAGNCGGSVPALTCRHAGLAHDSSASPAGGLAIAAMGAGVVGTYAVAQGDPAAAGGYTVGTFHQGTLTVNPASLTATAGGQSMIYGGVPALTCRHTCLVHGGVTAAFTGGLAATANSGSAVGGYPITQGTPAGTGNYTIATFHGGTPAVHPATLV